MSPKFVRNSLSEENDVSVHVTITHLLKVKLFFLFYIPVTQGIRAVYTAKAAQVTLVKVLQTLKFGFSLPIYCVPYIDCVYSPRRIARYSNMCTHKNQ